MEELDFQIFKSISRHKRPSEVFLGSFEMQWEYSAVNYIADCTIGIPFDLFDKVITGLLQIHATLSIEEMGEILGMNIVHNPSNHRIKDPAEYDILRYALDALQGYEMIEVGDTYYSRCRLTELGKEYSAKGMKFRTEANKPFQLFFDHLTNNHAETKSVLSSLRGVPIDFTEEKFFLEEELVKEVAAVQMPKIYAPERGNSIQNIRMKPSGSSRKALPVHVCCLYDFDTGLDRLLVLEAKKMEEIPSLSAWLTEHFLNEAGSRLQKASEHEFRQMPFEGYEPGKSVEAYSFWGEWEKLVGEDIEELHFHLSAPSVAELEVIQTWIGKHPKTVCWITVGPEMDEQVGELFNELAEDSESGNVPHFFFVSERATGDAFWIQGKTATFCLWPGKTILPFAGLDVSHAFFNSSSVFPPAIASNMTNLRMEAATSSMVAIFMQITHKASLEAHESEVSKERIEAYWNWMAKTEPLRKYGNDSVALSALQNMEETIAKLVAEKKETLKTSILNQLHDWKRALADPKMFSETELKARAQELKSMESNLFDDFTELKKETEQAHKRLEEAWKYLRLHVLSRTYVIDTNVFVDNPDIIAEIPAQHGIIVSLRVIDELDSLKLRKTTKIKAQQAIKSIHKALRSGKGKPPRIQKGKAKLDLLPEEMRSKSADNYLLSIAMGFRKRNAFLLTSDKNLHNKALLLDIPVLSPNELPNTTQNN